MSTLPLINPVRDLADVLLGVEKPARYVGGEYGTVRKDHASFSVGIAFPDLYEIGMSNQALRILYNGLNRLDDVACERVFAPAPDFEQALELAKVPLYTLERGLPLSSLDMIGITMGYELGITGALSILRAGGIPLRSEERSSADPIVFMGGPAVSNPAPFARFVDAIWIGEAEAGFFDLISDLRDLKLSGVGRSGLLNRIAEEDSVWMPGKTAKRAVYSSFATDEAEPNVYPVGNMRVVQDHGSVEIMRGCPNGCRFCHAGLWYRPMRQKSSRKVLAEVDRYITQGGYSEITLSSLSSGDYEGIDALVSQLNTTYRSRHISFQLPSLKISTFSLALLEQLSDVRKSGLTFAVETPVEAWQRSINKDVAKDNVIAILREAKSRGWRSAKFYFMIGLPVGNESGRKEEEEIVDFLIDVSRRSGVQLNVNVGTFVPKPHTPYQWAVQLTEDESREKMGYIRSQLKKSNFKVGTHDPFTSMLEGIIARGDERVGEMIEFAFNQGCRLDAWEDYIKKDVWRTAIDANRDAADVALAEKSVESRLPWDSIDPGVGKGFLKREYQRSRDEEFTSPCEQNCTKPCGVCSDDTAIVSNIIHDNVSSEKVASVLYDVSAATPPHKSNPSNIRLSRQIVFAFTKIGTAAFIPHLSLIEIFSKAFIRSALPVRYTEGFNPLPRLNFAAPLSVGIMAQSEVAVIELDGAVSDEYFVETLNRSLPAGITISRAYGYNVPEGVKKVSAASILWGFTYIDREGNVNQIPVHDEKIFRSSRPRNADGGPRFELTRTSVLAKGLEGEVGISYFDAYAELYGQYASL